MGSESESSICQACGTFHLREVEGFGLLPRITSDCRSYSAGGRLLVCVACGCVQKVPDAKWLQEIAGIYANYEVYYQSGGDEQIVFDRVTGKPRRRSDVILNRLAAGKYLGASGHALDVGCGNGATLSAMSAVLPGWRLNGFEFGDSALPRLSQISGFTKLYTGSVRTINRAFDLVTLIHSLEHFPSPLDTLTRLHPVVGNGKLAIQVCNVDENPFDILIADHLMHFSPVTLKRLLRRAGFGVVSVAIDWVPKEISAVSKVAMEGHAKSPPETGGITEGEEIFRRMTIYIEWLKGMVRSVGELAGREGSLGIFGTSIAATWLAGQLEGGVSFFVDEDESRIGKQHLGRPIRRPSEIPPGSIVYLALAPNIASLIAARLASLPCTFVSPPPIENTRRR